MKKLFIIPILLFLSIVGFGQKSIHNQIEAELYDAMSGVQTQNTTDIGGGLNVGYIDKGDWMKYGVLVDSPGTYSVFFRVAALTTGAQFQLQNQAGVPLATINVPSTGAWQTWITVSATVTLTSGIQTLELVSTGTSGWNINWFSFTSLVVTGPIVVNPPQSNINVSDSIAKALATFSLTLDSTINKIRSTSVATITTLDTLSSSPNTLTSYWIHTDAEDLNTKDVGTARKFVTIKNLNGIYTVKINTDDSKYVGEGAILTSTWTVVLVGGVPVIRVTPVTTDPVKWSIYRTQHNTQL